MATPDLVFLYVTVPDKKTADHIADTCLSEGLVACTNYLPGMESKYHWQGRIETAQESVLILKTTTEREPKARARIETLHPYDTPCILSIPIQAGNQAYINWLKGSVG